MEVALVLAAIGAVAVAWHKVAVEHQEYESVGPAALLLVLALWIILGWLGVVRGPRLYR